MGGRYLAELTTAPGQQTWLLDPKRQMELTPESGLMQTQVARTRDL